jgi:ferredoxin
LCCYIEDFGYEAAPVPNLFHASSIRFDTQKHDPDFSVSVKEGAPNPDILVDFRVAAFAAGLGEFGYSKVFLTPEFGPFQRFVVLLTDAPLEADPIYEGHLCDRCMRCARACSGNAISMTETETITVAGHKVEFGKLDVQKCSVAYMGASEEYNPFLKKDADLSKVPETYHGGQELKQMVGIRGFGGNNPVIEGARGCMRECYAHLEERGVLTRGFVNRFREKGTKPWKITPEMRRAFVEGEGNSDENLE